MAKLTGEQIAAEKLDGWAYLGHGLQTRVPTGDFAAGLALVTAIGAAAERVDHHPDVDLRYTHVDLRLISHDTGAVTGRDIRLARTISALVADAGLTQGYATIARLELALDSPAPDRVTPFWTAVLGDDELPEVWFQESGGEEPRQHWHLDLWVHPDQIRSRMDAILAAGGTLVSDADAPSFWVLADAEGNNVCLCTWQATASDQ